MSADKHLSIFLRQMKATVYLILILLYHSNHRVEDYNVGDT